MDIILPVILQTCYSNFPESLPRPKLDNEIVVACVSQVCHHRKSCIGPSTVARPIRLLCQQIPQLNYQIRVLRSMLPEFVSPISYIILLAQSKPGILAKLP